MVNEPRGVIDLRVRITSDLFHAFDPSPMVGRDLNDDVEAYIVESALELQERHYRLVLHVVEPESDPDNKETIVAAVQSYFAYRSKVQARRLRLLLREGRQALVVGIGFLTLCWGLGFVATENVAEPFGVFLMEGLLIIGWVANWRPAEIFLFDWRPMKQRCETLDALAAMDIHFQTNSESIIKSDPNVAQADVCLHGNSD